MPRKSSHNEKTQRERAAYARYVRGLDYAPTVDQRIPFPASNEPGEDLSEPTATRRRELPFTAKLADHFKSKWIEWIVGLAIILGGYLMIDSKMKFSEFGIRFGNLKDEVSDLKQTSKDHDKEVQQQEIKLREHDVRLDNLEKAPKKTEPQKSP